MNGFARHFRFFSFAVLIAALLPAIAHAMEAGQYVVKRDTVDDDLYLAGAEVDLYATVAGDVVVAGGRLHLEGEVMSDVIAAGGTITLRGTVADDARLAGGDLRVSGRIGDDLVAAGGRIHISPVAEVGGRAWLSGGEVRIDGRVADELRAGGGRVVIGGAIDGNVELWGEEIIIEDTAVISGNLHYRSAREARIATGARIDGEVRHTAIDIQMKPVVTSVIFAGLAVLFSIIVTAVLLYLLFPDFSLRVSQSLRDQPWLSLGIGLAVFAGVPVLIVILFSTAVGVWLALMLLAVYLVMLLPSYFIGALSVANAGLKLMHKVEISTARRATALAVALFLLGLVNLIPLLGSLANWAVLLAGIGALSRQLYLMHRA